MYNKMEVTHVLQAYQNVYKQQTFQQKTDICNIITGYMYMSFKEGNFNISFFSLLQFKGWQKCNKMANNCKIEEHL